MVCLSASRVSKRLSTAWANSSVEFGKNFFLDVPDGHFEPDLLSGNVLIGRVVGIIRLERQYVAGTVPCQVLIEFRVDRFLADLDHVILHCSFGQLRPIHERGEVDHDDIPLPGWSIGFRSAENGLLLADVLEFKVDLLFAEFVLGPHDFESPVAFQFEGRADVNDRGIGEGTVVLEMTFADIRFDKGFQVFFTERLREGFLDETGGNFLLYCLAVIGFEDAARYLAGPETLDPCFSGGFPILLLNLLPELFQPGFPPAAFFWFSLRSTTETFISTFFTFLSESDIMLRTK